MDIMDEEGDMEIPVTDTKWLKHDIVGTRTVSYAEQIGLGSQAYTLIDIQTSEVTGAAILTDSGPFFVIIFVWRRRSSQTARWWPPQLTS